MASNFGSNFAEKYRTFMQHRNGPDQLSRDTLVLAIILLIISIFLQDTARNVVLTLALACAVYGYFRMFSSKIAERSRENSAYIAQRNKVVSKVSAPFNKAKVAGNKAATRAKDKEHRYFSCPKCGQQVRVPKGAGKIRVKCPKCGEKFERKA